MDEMLKCRHSNESKVLALRLKVAFAIFFFFFILQNVGIIFITVILIFDVQQVKKNCTASQ